MCLYVKADVAAPQLGSGLQVPENDCLLLSIVRMTEDQFEYAQYKILLRSFLPLYKALLLLLLLLLFSYLQRPLVFALYQEHSMG